MDHITPLIGVVIATALVFDFTNGFHDTANAMATTISTGAMGPRTAVAMSAVLNLAGAFLSVKVALTISGGIIDEHSGIRPQVIFAALVGAIVWNLVTWLAGLPSSSSHALFGGLIGATLADVGTQGVHGSAVVTKVLLPAVLSPLVAGVAAWASTRLTYRVTRGADEGTSARGYRAGQIASAGLVSLAHGTNDAQKTMGVITLALVAGHVLAPGTAPPVWVILSAGTAMALGTYFGGWRIIRTMGKGLTDVRPPEGFAAQTGAATVILVSSHLGFALSTTHVCSGAVLGSGVGRGGHAVRWRLAGRIALSWLVTLPAAAVCAGGAALLADRGTWGVVLVGLLGLAVCAAVRVLSLRRRIDRHNVNDAYGSAPADAVAGPRDPAAPQGAAAVADPPAGGRVVVPLREKAAERRARRCAAAGGAAEHADHVEREAVL